MRLTEAGSRVYWVDLRTMTLCELPGLRLSFIIPKVCYLAGNIYAFWKSDAAGIPSQKYCIQNKKWTSLDVHINDNIVFALPDSTQSFGKPVSSKSSTYQTAKSASMLCTRLCPLCCLRLNPEE